MLTAIPTRYPAARSRAVEMLAAATCAGVSERRCRRHQCPTPQTRATIGGQERCRVTHRVAVPDAHHHVIERDRRLRARLAHIEQDCKLGEVSNPSLTKGPGLRLCLLVTTGKASGARGRTDNVGRTRRITGDATRLRGSILHHQDVNFAPKPWPLTVMSSRNSMSASTGPAARAAATALAKTLKRNVFMLFPFRCVDRTFGNPGMNNPVPRGHDTHVRVAQMSLAPRLKFVNPRMHWPMVFCNSPAQKNDSG
jgi:hypothetical protein